MEQLNLDLFFTQLSRTESLILMALCLAALLIGLLLGVALRNGKVRRLQNNLTNQEAALNQRQEQLNEQSAINIQKEVSLKKLTYELNQARLAADRYEAESKQLQQQLQRSKASTEEPNTTPTATLQQQVTDLKARNEELQAELNRRLLNQPPLSSQQLAAFEARLSRLEAANTKLQSSIGQLHPSSPATQTLPDIPEPDLQHLLQPQKDLFKSDRALLSHPIRDDLHLIEGIGPFIEQKLNDIGIYTFNHIASWTADDIERITQQLQYFPGRITKDRWVEQAQQLATNPTSHPSTQTEDTTPLTRIEGIGPKIARILADAGIDSFNQLARSEPAELLQILQQADPRYQMYDPTTWPAQARLAANGNWEVLEDYQAQLKGGRDTD